MKREVGASAGILALIALVLHTQYPAAKEVSGGPPTADSPERQRRQPAQDHDEWREGPWVATRAFFQKGEAPTPPAAVACAGDSDAHSPCLIAPGPWSDESTNELRRFMGLEGPIDHYRIWSIVATMADPSHTRLPLFLDRQVEALTRALQPQPAASNWQGSGCPGAAAPIRENQTSPSSGVRRGSNASRSRCPVF